MKKSNVISFAMSYAGCFLGAGFVSGQELWQFFGCFGVYGIMGLVISIILMVLFGILFFSFAKTGKTHEDMIVTVNAPALKTCESVLQTLLMFGVIVIMMSGAGALSEQVFGLPRVIGSGVFSLCCVSAAYGGVGRMMRIFSVIVPVIAACAVCFFLLFIARYGFSLTESENPGSKNLLLSNWVIAAVAYVSYNIFGTFGIMDSFAGRAESKKRLCLSLALSGTCLAVIALCVLLPQLIIPGCSQSELPMLTVAKCISGGASTVYAVVLLFGMFGASFSSLIATAQKISQRLPEKKQASVITLAVLTVLAWAMSFAGFARLISIIYPVFGYIGTVCLIIITVNYFFNIRKSGFSGSDDSNRN